MEIWDTPIYNPTFAGQLVNLSPGRVKRWLQGYEYKFTSGTQNVIKHGQKGPVLKRSDSDIPAFASFLDIIDLLFVKQLLEHGISLQKIRSAFIEAENILGGHHFAQKNFFTDGKSIYLKVKNKADALLELLSGGQWVIADFIKELVHQIEFDRPTGFARRWFPLGQKGLIVLDPFISFGKPTLIKKNIPTENIFDCYLGEDKSIINVSHWFNIDPDEVKAAVTFELSLKAA